MSSHAREHRPIGIEVSRTIAFLVGIFVLAFCSTATRADSGYAPFEKAYPSDIVPLVKQYCSECHSEDRAEAEIDLTAFASFADVRKHPETWQKVREMLDSGQMPPEDSVKPTDVELAKLKNWTLGFLKEEAKRNAGDPGPVVLRRLTNAEYTYVLRDLTGVPSLSPANEFPVDGAAGEGFTNAGQGLVMSPSLLTKYLDAGKEVAAHAALLPDGIRFSSSTTRRDWTEERLAAIRKIYGRYTESKGASQVNLQGIVFDTNGGGRLPVEEYLAALLTEREALANNSKKLAIVASERGLSPKYLTDLYNVLNAKPVEGAPQSSSLLLDNLRTAWQTAKPSDAAALAGMIAPWQQALWRFTSVGHIGKVGGPKAWMEPVNPLMDRQELRIKLPEASDGKEVVLYLVAGDAGDGNEGDLVVWERPRLVAPGRPDLLLRDIRPVMYELDQRRERVIASAAQCLNAAADATTGPESAQGTIDVNGLAKKHGVDTDALAAWLDYLGVSSSGPAKIQSPLTRQTKGLAGYDFVQGWIGDDALSIVANSSDQNVRVPGNLSAHSIAVHPSPSLQVAIGWRSPVATTVRIEGMVQHAHPECGNGVSWTLELRRGNTRQRLATGIAHGPNRNTIGPIEKIAVQPGDLVSLVIDPRDANHSCDLTMVDLTLKDDTREWNLAGDVSGDILAGNPHGDRQGNKEVWHFYSEPSSGAQGHVIPAGSLLARWQSAGTADERQTLAKEIQQLLQTGPAALANDAPDVKLYRDLTSLAGPLFASALHAVSAAISPSVSDAPATNIGLDPSLFGKHPNGSAVDPASLCVQAPRVIELRLPSDLVAGAELVTTGTLHAVTSAQGSAQCQILTTPPPNVTGLKAAATKETIGNGPWTSNNRQLSYATPILVAADSPARKRIESSFDEFRQWFPAALCYTKIVPVDEVVTLTLYYREDDALCRLMLSDEETAELNRLWDELHFVSQDALTLVDAFEQLLQYATQDADPTVFEPMRKPIYDRAAAYRQRLVDVEPVQLDAALEFAGLAYRRPLSEGEAENLRGLYRVFRSEELGHEDAIRLLLARILISPAFLYRAEKGVPVVSKTTSSGETDFTAHAVTDPELATRLSFFLWSSLPDAELREVASSNNLSKEDSLLKQTHRMLKDDRARRLATEFACQWVHIYEFDLHDEKSPETFPTFAGLRSAMYEESIRFFTDLLQRDGSVLEVLDADHTFLTEDLAKHYGISDVTGPEWRRVDGLRQNGRGGILGMATTLSKQSGASRTSPILRGTWISEVVLGEKLPKPPKGIPPLPETVPVGLTERQLIEKHSSDASCAKCHARIDPLGFSLENFDAIGRARKDAAPKDQSPPQVDVHAKLVDGTEFDGLEGLRNYLVTTRRDSFVHQFCKKLLGYALGRGVQLSDEPLLDAMKAQLQANNYRISAAIDTIVLSSQFQKIRDASVEQAVSFRPTDAVLPSQSK